MRQGLKQNGPAAAADLAAVEADAAAVVVMVEAEADAAVVAAAGTNSCYQDKIFRSAELNFKCFLSVAVS